MSGTAEAGFLLGYKVCTSVRTDGLLESCNFGRIAFTSPSALHVRLENLKHSHPKLFIIFFKKLTSNDSFTAAKLRLYKHLNEIAHLAHIRTELTAAAVASFTC
ncbi:MAG: hypothetical protein ACKESB_03795 [Candidatus Hodgkinia cicadicola]